MSNVAAAGVPVPTAEHLLRRAVASARIIARYEQSAIFHELVATRFEELGREDLASAARRVADRRCDAAAAERDRQFDHWPDRD